MLGVPITFWVFVYAYTQVNSGQRALSSGQRAFGVVNNVNVANIHGDGPQRHNWPSKYGELAEFIIDETFGVPGVGTVVAGTVKRGVIRANTQLLLGPDVGDGSFKPTAIKSIHYKRVPVTTVR